MISRHTNTINNPYEEELGEKLKNKEPKEHWVKLIHPHPYTEVS